MVQTITHLGEIAVVGGMQTPIDLTLTRNGVAWDLSSYTGVTLRVWESLTKTIVPLDGTLAVSDAPNGVVRYTPAPSDSLYATSGSFEARVWCQPAAGDPEPSNLFRFTIAHTPA